MAEEGSRPGTHRQHPRLPLEPLGGAAAQRGEDAEVAGLARVPLAWQEGTAQGLQRPRAGWHGGSHTHLLSFHPLDARISLARKSRSWAVLGVPQLELGTAQPSPVSPTLSPLGPAGPGASWGNRGNIRGAAVSPLCLHPDNHTHRDPVPAGRSGLPPRSRLAGNSDGTEHPLGDSGTQLARLALPGGSSEAGG